MKNLLLATTAILAVASSASAAERFPKWYLGLTGGVADQRSSDFKNSVGSGKFKYDTGYEYGASLGYYVGDDVRVELEGTQHRQDIKDSNSSVKANVVAVNALYDFTNSSAITPYIGAGLGYGKFHIDGGTTDGSDTKAVYQGLVGLGYETAALPNVGFSLGYRYMAPFQKPEVGTGALKTKYEYDNHSIEAGAKFRF